MPTYLFRREDTGEEFERVLSIKAKTPQNMKELKKLVGETVKAGDENIKLTKLINNIEGGFVISGSGVYSPGFKGKEHVPPPKAGAIRKIIK